MPFQIKLSRYSIGVNKPDKQKLRRNEEFFILYMYGGAENATSSLWNDKSVYRQYQESSSSRKSDQFFANPML